MPGDVGDLPTTLMTGRHLVEEPSDQRYCKCPCDDAVTVNQFRPKKGKEVTVPTRTEEGRESLIQ